MGVETGGCPHTAIREDASMNLAAIEDMNRKFPHAELCFVESGGDNLAATFSPELADLTIYVIDVAALKKNGGPSGSRAVRLHARSGRAQDTTFAANFRRGIRVRSPDRAPQGVLGVPLSLLLRNSIAQRAAMVSRSLMMWVALTLANVAGVRVGSSRSRTCFETGAVAPLESNCLIASIVAKRCAVVSFIASRFL